MSKKPETPHPRGRRFRSQLWFDNPGNPGMTALYLERYLNNGLTREERAAHPHGFTQSGDRAVVDDSLCRGLIPAWASCCQNNHAPDTTRQILRIGGRAGTFSAPICSTPGHSAGGGRKT
jgi:hypothetical protein